MKRKSAFLFLVVNTLIAGGASAQESTLTVQQIMQDPDSWIGSWPSSPSWSEDGETLYFYWNPTGQFPSDSLYKVGRNGGDPVKVSPEERRDPEPTFSGWFHGEHTYDASFQRKIYTRDGNLYIYDRRTDMNQQVTDTRDRISNARFTPDGKHIVYNQGDNIFLWEEGGLISQITDLRRGNAPRETDPDEQDAFLEAQQSYLFETLRRRSEERDLRETAQEREEAALDLPPTFYTDNRNVGQLQLDPSGRFVTFMLSDNAGNDKMTKVQSFVTDSGYTEELNARAKVGAPGGTSTFYIQDLDRDTTYQVDLHQVPGAYDVPAYLHEQGIAVDSSKTRRELFLYGPSWSGDGAHAVVEVQAEDNKDRWIARLDPVTGTLTVLDRQHDDAWIAGPGIGWRGTMGWLTDNRHFYFQSEKTGYSHLYTVDVAAGETHQLTSGDFEVFSPFLSRDGRTFYFTSSEGSPFERHYYRMDVDGGPRTRLTTLTGNNAVALNPDEQTMAIIYSYTNQPPEIYLKTAGDRSPEPERLTHSTRPEWEAYAWRNPEIRHFEASDGVQVPAHVFIPENPIGAAVLFVHGAGYLQNVHRWWSSYFREYMFNNMLTDLGYYVMNVDYRGSSGYGRDWRTAIYRYMGGRDLQDYVDASMYLNETYGIDPERIFIYGGSYGGFMTLMALFTEPEHFGGGAALRSVTDWAHYNHGYTSDILNTPASDSLAFARSSPIYFAEGLEDPLLIPHGMVDTNVHFQDVVRLAQRLIELGKTDWEMAVYPIEGHGFIEPESWSDEYRRILEYIRKSVGE